MWWNTSDEMWDTVRYFSGSTYDIDYDRTGKILHYKLDEMEEAIEGKANAADLHAHTNKAVLDGITAEMVNGWNNPSEDTAEDVLAKIKEVDGENSGLDADTLDGKQASEFATATQLSELGEIVSGKSDNGHNHDERYLTETEIESVVSTINTAIAAKANPSDIPTKTSQLTNDSGFKTVDTNTTYALSKNGSTITLTGSDGSTTSVTDADSNTTYGKATDTVLGLVKVGYAESGKNYPVELNANGQMFVNVPWTDTNTDTNTTYSLTKSGSTIKLVGSDGSETTVTDADTNTTYGVASNSALGLVKVGFPESGKNYPVELNSANQMFVNVPWTDNNTVYTHPTYTAKSSGLYKVAVDETGHVSGATAVTKADITALGIPAQDTTYTLGSFGVNATATELNYMDGVTSNVQTQLNNKVTVGNNIIVEKTSSPYVRLNVSNTSLDSRLYKNASSTVDYGTCLADYASDGTRDSLILRRENDLAQKLSISVANEDGSSNAQYFIYGTHNKPTAADVGALSTSGGTVNGDTNIAGILRVNGQQSFYFQTSTMSQTVGTNNATGGTTICCGANANVGVNGANLMTPNCLPKSNNAYYCGNANYRWKGIYSAAAVNVSSDERLKENIVKLHADEAVDFINSVDVCSFNYIGDNAEQIGVMAQDILAKAPNLAKALVTQDENGYYGVKTSDLVFPLIIAVQELTKQLKELKGE